MATINISASDSHSARQAKLDSAAPGDTVVFQNGDHIVPKASRLEMRKSGTSGNLITYTCESNAWIVKEGTKGTNLSYDHSEPNLRLFKSNYVKYNGVNIWGGSTYMKDADNPGYQHVYWENCKFRRVYSTHSGALRQVLDQTRPLRYGHYKNNDFRDCNFFQGTTRRIHDTCLFLYFLEDVEISGNYFRDIQEAIHIIQDWGTTGRGAGVVVKENVIERWGRMAIEIQGAKGFAHSDGMLVHDNVARDPAVEWASFDWDSCFAFSVVPDSAINVRVYRNIAIGCGKPNDWLPANSPYRDPKNDGVRDALELSGVGIWAYDNIMMKCANGIQLTTGRDGRCYRNIACEIKYAPWGLSGHHPGANFYANDPVLKNRYYTDCSQVVIDPGDPQPEVPELPTIDAEIPAGSYTWLSDMSSLFTVRENGWGPIELDMSNGETGAGDGRTIQMKGVKYAKGLGVHSYSKIVLPLAPGKYSRFKAVVGVDDEVPSGTGGVQFVVSVDGVKVWESTPDMKSRDDVQYVDVSVQGGQQLMLEVLGGANRDFDHANWAFARLEHVVTTPEEPGPSLDIVRKFEVDLQTDTMTLTFTDNRQKSYSLKQR